jgi:cell division septation protein DedD
MRNNETGVFELVVGNRQLLSGFFIVVLLFAVAFAMGYVVGQSAPRSSKVSETAAAAPAPVVDANRPAPAASAAPPAAAPETPAAQPPDGAAATAPPAESDPAAAAAAPPAPDTPAPSESSAAAAPALAPGTYWQLMAVKDVHDAQVVAMSLKDKGLPVVVTPGTKNLTRVLVGPYGDKQGLGRAKTDLENAGFHPILFNLK